MSLHYSSHDTAAEEQGKTARAAGKVIAGISALVRPIVTYAFVTAYFCVKLAAYLLALEQNGDWRVVLLDLWNKDDMAMLSMILSFWFLSRTLHHMNNGKGYIVTGKQELIVTGKQPRRPAIVTGKQIGRAHV